MSNIIADYGLFASLSEFDRVIFSTTSPDYSENFQGCLEGEADEGEEIGIPLMRRISKFRIQISFVPELSALNMKLRPSYSIVKSRSPCSSICFIL